MENVWIRCLVLSAVLASGPVVLVACDHDEHPKTPSAEPGPSESLEPQAATRSDECTSKLDGTTERDLAKAELCSPKT